MFDVDKIYVMRKEIGIVTKSREEIFKALKGKLGYNRINDINTFLDQISNSDQRDAGKANYSDIWKEYVKIAYTTKPSQDERINRNNKIIDMTWEVLTHEDTADKLLNPGGFEEQKHEGYLAQAARITGQSITELEHLSTDELKKKCATDKNLAFIGTHAQFYKQNAAAGSILAIFAVAKVAHACLEGNEFKVDVNQVCDIKKPITIMGLTFDGKMEIDPQKDIEGNFIGKTLGSLVASAADAIKAPVLNLMNINNDTVNVLNTLIRLGLPFKKASRLLSSQVVSDLLVRLNSERLSKVTSFNKILDSMLTEISDANNNLQDSDIVFEDLTEEEINNAILNRNSKVDYKILLTIQRVGKIHSAMKGLNFATRFNSISSAVGPLIIDNLKIENTLNNFPEGIYTKDDIQAGYDDVFALHPILEEFSNTVKLARDLFGNQFPTYSRQFANILAEVASTSLGSLFYNDRRVFSRFNDFYLSYLLVANGVIYSRPESVKYYIEEFPTKFIKENFKEKYAGNPFIDAIRFDTDDLGNTTLSINVTGLDNETKSKLTSGWLDLYKAGDEGKKLAGDLFNYCFHKGGIGFNPKTFMNLLPFQLRSKIKGYKETFEKVPDSIEGVDILNQFIRNNWNDDKVVPNRRFEKPLQVHSGGYIDFHGDEASVMRSVYAFKTRIGQGTVLFIRDSLDPETGAIVYKEYSPLGNNGSFMEISPVIPLNSALQTPTNPKTNNTVGEQTEDVVNSEIEESTYNTEASEDTARDLANRYFTTEEKQYLQSLKREGKLEEIKDAITKKLQEQGVEVNQDEVNAIVAIFC